MEKQEQIAYATKQMIPALTELWLEAFGDDRAYVDFYFENRFHEKNMLLYLVDKEPVAMISMLPAILHQGGKRQEVRYIYAVATSPAYRRRGYARKLIEAGRQLLQVPFILEPATKPLAAYYEGMGFTEGFQVTENELILPSMQAAAYGGQRYWLLTVTPSEYKQIRDGKLAGEGYVEWDVDAISYALQENDFCGGYAYKVFHDNIEDIMLYRLEEDCLNIIETTLSDADIQGVIEKLRIAPAKIQVRRPAGAAGMGKSFGMVLGDVKVKCGYLNLTLE